jgi:protein ImuA
MPPDDAPSSSPAALAALKRRIAAIEGRGERFAETPGGAGARARAWRFGIEAIDAHLPAGGLARGGLHEIAPASHGDMGATLGFALALLETLPTDHAAPARPVFWCQSAEARREFGRPYGPGLARRGPTPASLFFLTARRESDALWALEEAVRSRALTAVAGELGEVPFLASRRLALAAAEARIPVLLVSAHPAPSSAAHTRWRVGARAGTADPWDARAPGDPGFALELIRARGGSPTNCDVEWSHETRGFRLAALLADRADACGREAREAERSSAAG